MCCFKNSSNSSFSFNLLCFLWVMPVPCAVSLARNQLLLSNWRMEFRVSFLLQTVRLSSDIALRVLTQFCPKTGMCRFRKIDTLARTLGFYEIIIPYLGVLNLQPGPRNTVIGPSPANVRLITRNHRRTLENKEMRPFHGTVLRTWWNAKQENLRLDYYGSTIKRSITEDKQTDKNNKPVLNAVWDVSQFHVHRI